MLDPTGHEATPPPSWETRYLRRMGDIADRAIALHARKGAELRGDLKAHKRYLDANWIALKQVWEATSVPWIHEYLRIVK